VPDPSPTTPKKTVYRVRPIEGGWRIELAGDSVAEYAELKAEAIERAKVLARRSPRSTVVVVGPGGEVEQELELGALP
jgi:hypothetical protein